MGAGSITVIKVRVKKLDCCNKVRVKDQEICSRVRGNRHSAIHKWDGGYWRF